MPDQWNNFFDIAGGGSAALSCLIFVAMPINHQIIILNTTHKNRAINMLTGFTAIFMASSLSLIGNQAGGTICYLAEVAGAICLRLGYNPGLYIAAIAIIVLFAFLISGAWLLMIGIYEGRTK